MVKYRIIRVSAHAARAISPRGRGVTKPLKKLFSEQRVPSAARDALPVLASGGTVLWAAGFGFAEGLAPDEFTKTAVTVTARQMEEVT